MGWIACIKGLIAAVLIGSLLTIYAVLKTAEYSGFYAKSYADYVGYRQDSEVLTKIKIMPRGGDELLSHTQWDIPDVVIHNDSSEFIHSATKRYIASNFSFSPGMGNIMFQYASLYSLALKHNATLLVPESILLRRSFKLNATFVSVQVLKELLEEWKPRLVYSDCCRYYNETAKLNFTKPRAMMGYFQSFKYFHPEFTAKVRHQFSFLPTIKSQADEYIRKALITGRKTKENVTFIAVHVRRGMDMTWNMRNMEHGHKIATKRYLTKAMDFYREKYRNALFIVCSDDVFWVRQNLLAQDVISVTSSSREVDLCVLSMCNHTVMSQGTFSWWAAYLAGGDTVYYKEWPRKGSKMDEMLSPDDYFLPHWIGMS